MSIYWSQRLAALKAYVPGEQPRDRRYIKLNTNENPYPPTDAVINAVRCAADGSLRLYPDPTCLALRSSVASHHGLTAEEVFAGNGSDEILAFAFAAFLDHGEPILYPDITYSFYPVYTDFFGLNARIIPLREDFSIPVDDFLIPNGGIVLCNPNAPTSLALPVAEVERIVRHNLALGRVVIVDEAYIDFGGTSVDYLVRDCPNLLVVRTLSKSRSLAGLRVGYALGSAELIEGLEKVKSSINSYTLNRLAIAGGAVAFEDEDYFLETRRKVIATRRHTMEKLRELGFSVADSAANFIFITHPVLRAQQLYTDLRERGILVRYFDKPRIDNHLRVSIGTSTEMETFLECLRSILAQAR